ncbi:hypothetical protein GGI07_002014 [Coemansia sp. Benny D115]|nr:hypothetical protein GGI07_002014 [Coemansia sp. Benny D115]
MLALSLAVASRQRPVAHGMQVCGVATWKAFANARAREAQTGPQTGSVGAGTSEFLGKLESYMQAKRQAKPAVGTVVRPAAPAVPRGKALLQERIQERIRQRLEKVRREERGGQHERAPRDEEIKHAMITLILEDGTVDGVHPLAHVLRTMDREQNTLVLVDGSADPPSCRVFSRKLLYERERQARKAARKSTTTKLHLMQVKVTISENDLATKLRKASRVLEKGGRVEVEVTRVNNKPDCRAEIGRRIVDAMAEEGCKPASPPIMGPASWTAAFQGHKSA